MKNSNLWQHFSKKYIARDNQADAKIRSYMCGTRLWHQSVSIITKVLWYQYPK